MKLNLSEPKLFVEPISVISELVNEVQLKIDKEKIEIAAIDPANAAMIVFKLLSSAFTDYSVDKPVTIALSLDSLKAVLRRAKPSDVLKLELDSEKNRLKIQIKGDSTRTFNLSLIDIEEKQQKIPDLKFSAKIETPTAIFEDAINDMDVVGESVTFCIDNNKFTMEAESNLSDAKAEIDNDNETTVNCNSTEAIKSKYSLEYLKKIAKGGKLASKVVIQFGNEYPLKIGYAVKDKLLLETILAPRVQTD